MTNELTGNFTNIVLGKNIVRKQALTSPVHNAWACTIKLFSGN